MAVSGEIHNKSQGIRAGIYGDSPMDYADIFRQSYKNLNQVNANPEVVKQGTTSLADNFIERIYEKTGQFPSENQIRDFVSANLTPRYAEQFIQGTLPNDAVKTQLVDPYLRANADDFPKVSSTSTTPTTPTTPTAPTLGEITSGLRNRQDEIYGGLGDFLSKRINDIYNKQKAQALEEEASQGSRLYSGVSRAPGSSLNTIEENRGNSLSSALASLATQRASGETDLSKVLAGVQESERRAGELNSRFGQELGLRKLLGLNELDLNRQKFGEQQRQTDINRGLQERGFSLSELLGRLQAQSREPGTLDYINTGANALEGIAKAYSAFRGR